jgi:conjugative transposon TraJ protein
MELAIRTQKRVGMGKRVTMGMAVLLLACFPVVLQAQDLANSIDGLHGVLAQMYNTMIQQCAQLYGVAQGIAAFAATMYIGYRVWRHIANAEPIDFFPLFRPFVISFCIVNFTSVLAVINGLMSPVTDTTAGMVQNSNAAITQLLAQKEAALKNTVDYQMYVGASGSGDYDKWYSYTNQEPDGMFGAINELKFFAAKMMYNLRNSIKVWLSEILNLLYEAAALCIDCIRTFQLVVLAILGPLVFALSIFDGFQHTLSAWLARYINIYLWLPVANLFGAIIGSIQQQMIQLDIQQIVANGSTSFSSTDTAYLIFLIIGIIGYTTVPSVANYIVNAGGGGALLARTTSVAGSTAGRAWSGARNIAGAPASLMSGYNSPEVQRNSNSMASAFGRAYGRSQSQADRLSGDSKES